MKLISKITATVLVASLVVPAAFAATTAGTLASKSSVAQMKKMGMKKTGMKKMGMKKGMKKGMKGKGMKKMGMKKSMKKM